MPENEKEIYFSNQALARFVASEGKKVEKVICHLWQNTIDKSGTVEIIDNVELHFGGALRLTIACNEEGNGLDAIEFDYQKTAREIQNEFDGKIRLFAVDASATKMWKDVIGLELLKVKVSRQGDYYLADSLVLDFGNEKREISAAPLDGLIIDYYEE